MHKHLTVLWLLSIACFGALAQEQKTCASVPDIRRDTWPYNEKCDCSNGLNNKYSVKSPAGLALVAVCDHDISTYKETFGSYYFMGSTVVKGQITHNENDSGMNLSFIAPGQGPYEALSSAMATMWFYEEDAAFKAFKLPPLTPDVRCWRAATSLKITTLLVVLGSGDQQGTLPLKYQVLDLEPYEACEPKA